MIFFLPVIGCGESFGFGFNNTHSKSALLVLTNGTERGPILSEIKLMMKKVRQTRSEIKELELRIMNWGTRIEFRGTVNLLLSGTVHHHRHPPKLYLTLRDV